MKAIAVAAREESEALKARLDALEARGGKPARKPPARRRRSGGAAA